MRKIYVVTDGQRTGPFSESDVTAKIEAGTLAESAELIDADSGDFLLAEDLMQSTHAQDAVDGEGAQPNRTPYGKQEETPKRKGTGLNPGVFPLAVAFFFWPLGLLAGLSALKTTKALGYNPGFAIAAIVVSSALGIYTAIQFAMILV